MHGSYVIIVYGAGGSHESGLTVQMYFVNELGEAFAIRTGDIYGSTAADFDLNISRTATAFPSLQVRPSGAM